MKSSIALRAPLAFTGSSAPPPGRLAFIMGANGPTAQPQAIDAKAREVWGSIYEGNVPPQHRQSLATEFAQRQYAHIHKQPPFPVPTLSAEEVLLAF